MNKKQIMRELEVMILTKDIDSERLEVLAYENKCNLQRCKNESNKHKQIN